MGDPSALVGLLPEAVRPWAGAALFLAAAAGTVAVWWLGARKSRAEVLHTEAQLGVTLGQRADRLIDQLQEELGRAQNVVRAYEADIRQLRRARWELDDTLMGLRDAALAARTMVHELQRRLGEPETPFPPLPRPVEPPVGGAS